MVGSGGVEDTASTAPIATVGAAGTSVSGGGLARVPDANSLTSQGDRVW